VLIERYDLIRCKYDSNNYKSDKWDELISTKNVFCDLQDAELFKGGRKRRPTQTFSSSCYSAISSSSTGKKIKKEPKHV